MASGCVLPHHVGFNSTNTRYLTRVSAAGLNWKEGKERRQSSYCEAVFRTTGRGWAGVGEGSDGGDRYGCRVVVTLAGIARRYQCSKAVRRRMSPRP